MYSFITLGWVNDNFVLSNQNLENMICTKNSKLALQNQTMVKEAVPSCLQCLQYSFVMDDGFYWLCRLGLKLSLIYLLKYLGVSPTRVLSECIIRLILAKHSMQFSSNDKMFKAWDTIRCVLNVL